MSESVGAFESQVIPRRPQVGFVPLSFAQERLWFLGQSEAGSSAYNIPAAFRLTGPLNVVALEQSLNEIVRRHEALRTTFTTVDGQLVQVIAPALSLTLPVVDLRQFPEIEREAEAQRLTAGEARRPFDLAQGPLLRTALLRLGDEEHVLLLTMHHIVSDGWSIGTFNRELLVLYEVFSTGKSSPLPELPIQYADFAHWQRQWLRGEMLEAQLAYWKQQLGGSLPVLELPTDRPRPAVQTFRGAIQSFVLSKTLTKSLEALSRQEGVTLFMTLLAAFKTLLYRYTGQQGTIVGSPIANRNQAGIEGLIGSFVNTLVLRTDLSGNPAFRELLGRVREVTLGAYAHQDLPFEKLVEVLQPERDLSHNPLFQVMFVFQNAPLEALALPGLTVSPLELDSGTAKFDLTLSIEETERGFRGVLEYNTDLFDAAKIMRMAGHFQTLLEGVVANPQQRLSDLPLLTEAERHQLLVVWNDTKVDYPRDMCIHHLFEAQVERTPDAVAVIFEEEHLTYGELNRRTNQLAHYLQKLGVGPEVLVGIYMERSVEVVVSLLGVLKAGGGYVPLGPAYPKERLAFMLKDSQVPVLLTQERLVKVLPEHGVRMTCLDTGWEAIAGENKENLVSEVAADNSAYVIYTSGSTGRPKGVLVPHRGLPNVSEAQVRSFGVEPGDHVLQFASLGFDASIFEVLMALGVGATLCLGTQESLSPGPNLLRWLRDLSITIFTLTPSALAALPVGELPALRTANVAGEACPADLVTRWAESRRFFNLYGPTEATIWTTVAECTNGSRKPPIGCPIANMQVYLLDSHLQPVPTGVPGEMHIGGVGLARGYLNRPGLTAEAFVPNPFSDEPGARLYKTGDLARYLPDGNIEFLGRIDYQVKVRGFRIEPGEIEAVLRQHSAVRETVVLAREDVPGGPSSPPRPERDEGLRIDKRLVAYVVPQEGQGFTISDLRHFLAKKLPEYMVPSAFVTLEALPLTPNGKVDRRSLPAPDRTRPEVGGPFVAPRTLVEEHLAKIWAEVLGFEQVGIHDNFFDLGGHSLALTQVMSRALESFQVEMPLLSIFETPTIASLAESIERSRRAGQYQRFPPLEPATRDGPLPLTFAQEQVWFLQKLAPGNVAYNAQVTIRLRGQLNVAVLQQALTEIVRRHEILRTTFSSLNGQPVQIIHPPWTVPLPVVDLRVIPEKRREGEAEWLVIEASRRPFDTTRLPLIRWMLLQLDAGDHILVEVEHHFVHDGWSFAVLLREMKILYEAFSAGCPSPLPELSVQFADFAVWQRRWMQGDTLQNQLAYWKEQLAGSPPAIELPTDRPRPRVQGFQGAAHRITLSPRLYEALKALSLREGVTLFMTLLAALKTLLCCYTGQDDLPLGSAVANRRLRETEGLIGMFVNTVVLRTNLSGNPTFRELLGRVREVALGAYAHQDLPFEKLVEALRPERDLSRNPLFQVIFSFHDSPVPELEFSGLSGSIEYRQNDSAKFDLNVLVIPRAEQLVGRSPGAEGKRLTMIWEYNTDLFDVTTIERIATHFQVLLKGIVANPDQRLSDLPILTEAERHQLLVEWNNTQADYPQDKCIHELFEAQVERTPDAVAVVFGDQHLTYRELNRGANQLARHLQGLGVGLDTLVGICVERSMEVMVGLLGILKAGGAYMPLDPVYPKERLAFMLEDTQAPVLLTQQRLVERLPKHEAQASPEQSRRVVCLDADWDTIAQEDEGNPVSGVTAGNLAYVIYTSGSTGWPKGVQIEHCSLLNLVFWHQRAFAVSQVDRATQVAGLAFDASVWELWPYLAAGASIHLPDEETRASPERLRDWLVAEGITISFLPTPLAEAVLSLDWPDDVALRTLLTGGDRLNHYPSSSLPFELVNNYGPTENTVVTTSGPVPPNDRADVAPHIGRPISNTQTYLLDRNLQLVPVRVPGELCIGGDGLARDYLNRPELTAEKFIPNPFSDRPGARLYKTGDLARYLPDGNIEFLGHIDHQVKIRGFRIELGEIETVLGQHPGVREAVVLAREDEPGKRQVVGYVVPGQGRAPAVSELQSFLKEKLPDYMVPSAFVLLDALPLTPNGKVDRRALPAPEEISPELGETFVVPRTPVEEVLAGIWAEALGLERVGVYDDFFELGGHSLLATLVISQVRKVFLVELSLRTLFEVSTVAELSHSIIANETKPGQTEKIARALKRIEGMSAEEVREMLQKKKVERGVAR